MRHSRAVSRVPNKTSEPLEGRVRDITQSGDAVVETSAGIVMARGALPGERVRVVVLGKSQGTLRGRITERVEQRVERVVPQCPRVETCGGCPLMPLELPAQLAWKRERVAHALGLPLEALPIIAGPNDYAYRTRARLAFGRGKNGRGSIAIGYRAASSHDVVDAADCVVLASPLQAAYAQIREHMRGLVGSGEIALTLVPISLTAAVVIAHIECDALQPPETYRALEALGACPELAGVSLAVERGAAVKLGELEPAAVAPDGLPFFSPAFGFAQANRWLNDALVDKTLELADASGLRVLELYAGHGNFTLGLARVASELLAVESDREAVEACRRNLKERGLTLARVRADDAAKVASERGAVDLVVLDPPRTGAKDALAGIAARKPKRIVYVSCDPATLRRDVGILATLDYAIESAIAFDMFPHTPHVESVVRLARVKSARER